MKQPVPCNRAAGSCVCCKDVRRHLQYVRTIEMAGGPAKRGAHVRFGAQQRQAGPRNHHPSRVADSLIDVRARRHRAAARGGGEPHDHPAGAAQPHSPGYPRGDRRYRGTGDTAGRVCRPASAALRHGAAFQRHEGRSACAAQSRGVAQAASGLALPVGRPDLPDGLPGAWRQVGAHHEGVDGQAGIPHAKRVIPHPVALARLAQQQQLPGHQRQHVQLAVLPRWIRDPRQPLRALLPGQPRLRADLRRQR
jgi:hypothetical protein